MDFRIRSLGPLGLGRYALETLSELSTRAVETRSLRHFSPRLEVVTTSAYLANAVQADLAYGLSFVRYFILALTVFGINLLPVFGPPTWAVLVFARLQWHLNPVALVALGVTSATCGRYLLARFSRRFKACLPIRLRENLDDAQHLIERKRVGVLALFGTFVVSPLPSAQLFLAAGLLDLPLGLVSSAFILGRLLSYSIYLSIATVADQQLGGVVRNMFGSVWSILAQLVLFFVVCLAPFIRWRRFVK